MPSQFDNPANIAVHQVTTAQEILRDFPEGLDVLITGVGTGGHITGVAEVLKPKWPNLKVFAVEPAASPVISGGSPSPHPIQGIGAGFIPDNLHKEILDGVITVTKEEAYDMAVRSRQRRRHLHRRVIGRIVGRRGQEAGRASRRQPRPDVLLRHRRALLIHRRIVCVI